MKWEKRQEGKVETNRDSSLSACSRTVTGRSGLDLFSTSVPWCGNVEFIQERGGRRWDSSSIAAINRVG